MLYIPEQKRNWLPLRLGDTNTFVADEKLVKVHARFATANEPWANEGYKVQGAGTPDGTLDGDGNFNAEVPTSVDAISLRFEKRKASFTLRVGQLDPITTDSGVKQRLTHLGHLPRNSIASNIHEDAMHSRAVASFQAANGLPVTGIADEPTRTALVAAHGS